MTKRAGEACNAYDLPDLCLKKVCFEKQRNLCHRSGSCLVIFLKGKTGPGQDLTVTIF